MRGMPRWSPSLHNYCPDYSGSRIQQATEIQEHCPRCGTGWVRTYMVGANWKPYCQRCRKIVTELVAHEKKLEKKYPKT